MNSLGEAGDGHSAEGRGAGSDDELPQDTRRSVPPGPEDEVLNDDEREFLFWQSRYPDARARSQIRIEAIYTVAIVLVALLGLYSTWHGWLPRLFSSDCYQCDPLTLRRYLFLAFGGLLGGSLFALKYLYKVVARGYWNQDRAIWRYTSPLLSMGLAVAAGALTSAGLFGFSTADNSSGASFVSLGFIAGYFADSASRKMQEVAETLFGRPPPSTRMGMHP
ncbi:hypothetical protein [Pseudoxanthomonas sp.]|uniref:hypothetical protein n=1 Tax=Pseudoxanthomonas sp. TaxID=1871049 RepID=UPI00258D24C0|nr:hypothetical protein [Pseudoxanthomonas sp.]MCR6686569.1 hypothetical protein [Pseudoxanthomonas sp.]